MLRRKYRVSIEVDVMVEDLTRENLNRLHIERCVRDGSVPWADAEGVEDEALARQSALLAAFLKQEDDLDAWLQGEALFAIVTGIDEAVPPLDSPSLLRNAIEALPPAYRHKYREAVHREEWIEMSGEFLELFDARITGYSVSPVEAAEE
jgi:hypothetical protein